MLYKATIRSLGAFSSPLRSDTLFGAFAWSYRYLYGEELLEELLEWMMLEPQVIFSNAFPRGTLPLPQGIYDEKLILPEDAPRRDRQMAYRRGKKLKNARYIPTERFETIAGGNTAGFAADLREDGITPALEIHNMVDRGTGTVGNSDGSGNLYTKDVLYADCEDFDIYCYLGENISLKSFRRVLENMLLLGIGSKKSTGKGAFRLLELEEANLKLPREANGFMIISDFLPAKEDPANGRYRVFSKFPKVDREFSVTETPFKKPMLLVEAGSVFFCGSQRIRPFYGRCIDHISPLYDKIMMNGCGIALPMILKK